MSFLRLIFICLSTLLVMAFFNAAICSDSPSDASGIYLCKIEGGKVYSLTSAGKRRVIRAMEIIQENSILEIEPETTAYLTCPGCEVIKVTREDNPSPIKKEKFKISRQPVKIIAENFMAALKAFVYPDSKIREMDFMYSRGKQSESCRTMPVDSEAILFWGDHLMFNWELKGSEFLFEIQNTFTQEVIFSDHATELSQKVPMDIFSPGFVYEWSVTDQKATETCQVSFMVLTLEESTEIIKEAQKVVQLMPRGTDRETMLRLKAGFLVSQGYFTDAQRLIENNGF